MSARSGEPGARRGQQEGTDSLEPCPWNRQHAGLETKRVEARLPTRIGAEVAGAVFIHFRSRIEEAKKAGETPRAQNYAPPMRYQRASK